MKFNLKYSKFALIVCLVILLVIVFFVNIVFVLNSPNGLHDFGSFIASGRLALEGKNPYSADSPLIFSVIFPGNGLTGTAPNLNPPISVLIFKSFANFNPLNSLMVWRIISVIFFAAALFILHRAYPIKGFKAVMRMVGAFSLAGFWHNLQLGQIYTLLLLLTALVWVLIKNNRSIAAGLFLGILIAIKPNFIFWAFLLCLVGNWRSFLSAGLTAAGISSIPLLTNGFSIYRQWLQASDIFTPNLLLFPGNNSFQGLTARFGSSAVGIGISVLFALYISWHVFKTRPSGSKINGLGIIISLLISPIAWTGYTLLALPIFFEQQKWDWKLILGAAIFAVPFFIPLVLFQTTFTNFVLFGWFYGWGLLCLILWLLLENYKKKNPRVKNAF